MNTIKTLAEKRPFVFALLTILAWFFLGAVLAFGSAALLQVSIVEGIPQTIGTLGATFALLAITARMGWWRSIGIAHLGGWRVWLITLPLLVYMILAYWYGFFGNISFDPGIFARSAEAHGMLARESIVGFVEETLFRGIILYALVRVWGRSKNGLIASVIVQAALFGAIHILHGVGNPLSTALMVVMNSFVSAVWWGVIVLRWKSLWPTIVLHGLSNASVMIKGLSSASIEPATMAYIRATALELPLLILGLWLLLRASAHPEIEEKSQHEHHPALSRI